MKASPPTQGDPRAYVDRAIQTTPVSQDNWLVVGLVFGLRLFLAFLSAFARTLIIVSGDPLSNALLDEITPAALGHFPAQTDNSVSGSSETLYTGAASTSQSPRSPTSHGYYVVFIGREVGYTTSNSLMMSLVQGIPNNYSQRFGTLEEGARAYSEAAGHGNVRRVRTVVQPSGHVEFMYELVGPAEGIRNLDETSLLPQPVNSCPPPPAPTPCISERCTSPHGEAMDSTAAFNTAVADANGPIVPAGWSVVDAAREASADTVIIPIPTTSTAPTSANHLRGNQAGALTVIFLESDEDSSLSSVLVNNSNSSGISAHSSDIYYADKTYDTAFAAYIEEEERNAAGVEGGATESTILG